MLGPSLHSPASFAGKDSALNRVNPSQVRVVLLDIEGTTTPVDFVYKTLFPYAVRKVEEFLREGLEATESRTLLSELYDQHRLDEGKEPRPPAWRGDTPETELVSAAEYVRWLIATDSKCTPLKSLQGKIWQQGFDGGELRGEVYSDVPRAFARWRKQGREICIYSSGSVLAQKLLFGTIAAGDLTSQIRAYFDTQTGVKTSPESYHKIAASLGYQPDEILFLSDARKEIEAATTAGMQILLCQRDSPSPEITGTTAKNPVQIVKDFDVVLPD